MPTQLTIPVKPQFGVGQFEPTNVFAGLSGLRWAWGSSFGVLLPTFDEAFSTLGGGSVITLPPGYVEANGKITLSNITQGMTHTQHAKANELVTHAMAMDGLAGMLEGLGLGVLQEKKKTAQKTAPRVVIRNVQPVIKANLKPLTNRVVAAEKVAHAAKVEADELRHQVAQLRKQVKAQKPHAIAEPVPIPGGIREPITWPKIRPGKIEKWLGIAALAGLLAKVLERMGASYIRCNGNKRWGRHVCQNGSNFLSDLINATTLLVGTMSLLGFAAVMRDAMGETVPLLRKFWQVTDGGLEAVYASAADYVEMDWHVT